MSDTTRPTILVVDDTPANVTLMSGLLQQEYTVKAATNGERALKIAFGEQPPDLILLDIIMPEMDGYEVCRQLKANPATAQIPVIFLTAKSDSEDEALGLAMGAVDYITKPVSPAIALARINTQMSLYRHKQRIKETFGQYVDPRIVENLISGRTEGAPTGEKQVVTVYFSDLVAFTALAELLSPAGLVNFINEYFAVMSEPVRAHNGVIDKYIGDSIMAFWSPPFSPAQSQAADACLAAAAQLEALDAFRARVPDLVGLRKGVPNVGMRIGLASGDAIVGSIGSRTSRSFTVMGDTVNLGSRLEGANKVYGTRVLIDETTRTMAGDVIHVREIDSLSVVGKTEPVAVFELLGAASAPSPLANGLVEAYAAGLERYRAGDWRTAQKHFADCLGMAPDDGPTKTLLSRCWALLRDPPAHWNGAWQLASK
jgi:adenylate cyclase